LNPAALGLGLPIVGGISITDIYVVVVVGHNFGHREGERDCGYNTQTGRKDFARSD
jgi:hypothetical protein